MPPLHRRLLATVPVCVAASTALAQSPSATDTTLPAVVITGKKNPDHSTLSQPDLPTARRRIEQTPGGAGVVDAESYTQGRVSTLSDALGFATGVLVQSRFGAEEARLSIRGSGLQRTFHGRGLKLMQDGVPLNLADGSFDFQAVDALSARYVEVWRGANALQYGTSTLGGAINFVSPNGYNADLVRARAEAGRFDYRRGHVSTGNVAGALDYYLSAGVFQQDGFRRHAEQDTRRTFANIGVELTPQLETRVYLGYVDSVSELPGAITREQLERDPREANPGNVTGDQHRDIHWLRVSSKTVWKPDAMQQLEFFLYASRKQLDHPIFQVIEQHNRDWGMEARYTSERPLAGRANRLTLGIAPSRGTTDEDRFLNAGGDDGPRINASRHKARNVEIYAENQHHVLPRLALVTGLQWGHAVRQLDDRFVAGTPADPVDESFDERYRAFNPKLGLRWDHSPNVQFFFNASRSFEPPTFSELAGGVRPVLNDAQRGTTIEVGSRGRTTSLDWDVALYEARLKDELLQVATNDIGANITVNAPRTVHRGVEFSLAGKGFGGGAGRLEWGIAGLINDFRFRDDPTYGDRRLPGLPKYTARAQAGYRLAGGTLLQVHAEGASAYPIDFDNSFDAERYAIWGVRARGSLTSDISWFIEGRNLSDRRYAATTGVIRSAGGADAAQFFPGDGRAWYAGLDWRLDR